MKKAVVLLLAIFLLCGLAGCDKEKSPTETSSNVSSAQTSSESSSTVKPSIDTPESKIHTELNYELKALEQERLKIDSDTIVVRGGYVFDRLFAVKESLILTSQQYLVIGGSEHEKGLITQIGKLMLPYGYDEIYCCEDGIVVVKNGCEGVYDFEFKTFKFHEKHAVTSENYGWEAESETLYQLGDQASLIKQTDKNEILPVKLIQLEQFTDDKGTAVLRVKQQATYKWGFVKNNALLGKAEYEAVHWFYEGLAAVRKDSKWGFVNTKGDLVIPCQFEDCIYGTLLQGEKMVNNSCYTFSNGYAAVKKNGFWGYIDKNGNEATKFCYFSAITPFQNVGFVKATPPPGYVSEGEWLTFYFNQPKKLSEIDCYQVERIAGSNYKAVNREEFSQYVIIKKDGKKGLADYQGNLILPIQFDKIFLCFEGIIADDMACSADFQSGSPHGGHGLENGSYLWNEKEKRIYSYYYVAEPLTQLEDSEKGKLIRMRSFTSVTEEGIIVPEQEKALFGFMKDGKLAISVEYQDAHDFFYGLAAVKRNGKWGYIDAKGQAMIPFQYDDLPEAKSSLQKLSRDEDICYDFGGSYAAVCKDGKWGIINKQGTTIINFTYDKALTPYKNKAWVMTKEKGWELITLS